MGSVISAQLHFTREDEYRPEANSLYWMKHVNLPKNRILRVIFMILAVRQLIFVLLPVRSSLNPVYVKEKNALRLSLAKISLLITVNILIF